MMMKFKGVSKKKLLVLVGLSLVLAGTAAAGGYFLPGLGSARIFSLVGLSKPGSEIARSTSSPTGQDKPGGGAGALVDVPVTFSSKSQLVLAVRAMLNQQTELAQGKPGAGTRLKASMSIIAMMVSKIDVRALSTQEYDAAAVYVLSGGRPDILERIASEVKLDPERQSLFEGAISFVKGDLKGAAGKLAIVNAEKFEPVLAARIYMLQAHLDDKAPYETRKNMLQTAADTTLGTLFEEAATRRMVALAAENGELNDFAYWSDRYQRRFPYSLYFPDFWADVVKAIFATESRPNKFSLEDLHRLVLHVPEERKLILVRALILRSIKEGYPRLCQFGLDEAADSSGKSGNDVEALRLYKLVCAIGTNPEAVVQQLPLVDRSKLGPDDVALIEAANLLAKGALADGSGPSKNPEIYGPQLGYPGYEVVNERAASVAQQIEATNSVLKRAEK